MATAAPPPHAGFVLWMEGLSGSGKTTLARSLAARLTALRWNNEILDGDEVRQMFSPELGFSRKDRETHAKRVSYVARMLARNGVAVLVAMITPYETSRQAARSVTSSRFDEIYLKCPLEVCRQRDPKGIYKRSLSGGLHHLTGVDDPFEEPLNPDLTLDTSTMSIDEATDRILKHLQARGYLTA
jgi:adenylylsulfate kinase